MLNEKQKNSGLRRVKSVTLSNTVNLDHIFNDKKKYCITYLIEPQDVFRMSHFLR